MGLGLFQVLFLRVLGLIAAALLLLIALSHIYQSRHLNEAWSADLQQEAEWTARHFAVSAVNARRPGASPREDLGAAWRDMHESVRLVVRDAHGVVLVDSHPSQAAPAPRGRRPLVGRAIVAGPTGNIEVTLSRPSLAPFPLDASGELVAAALTIMLLAAAALYPWTRNLTRTFSQLAEQTQRVASGEFGAPITAKGGPELEALIASFNGMSQRLQEEETRRRTLIADVSHELRSPMGRIRALAETLARHPDETAPLVEKMEAEISLMDRLVGDMIETARFDQGRSGISLRPVAAIAWARESFERLRPRVESEGVSLNVFIDAPEFMALIDPQRLMQALGNLVDNAVVASAGREGAAISAVLGVSEQAWSITVSDNGRGIPKGKIAFVFDRFFRVEPDRGRTTGGAGLGLSIAKSIVEAHGGSVAIESELGRGARVTISFPLPEE